MKKAVLVLAACMLAGCGTGIGASSDEPRQTSGTTAVTTSATTQTTTASAPPQTATSKRTETSPVTDSSEAETPGILTSPEEIGLYDTDGSGTNYTFTYNGEIFTAIYTPDNWKIIDSYKITLKADIVLICEALASAHPIHGADMESWRTPEDMAFEWQEHNAAYMMLPESSEWKINVKDVDLNPEDQGKTGVQMALERLNSRNSSPA